MQLARRGPLGVFRWPLWTLSAPVLVVIVLVELFAVVSLVLGVSAGVGAIRPEWPWTIPVLVLAGILSTEASLGVERVRRTPDGGPLIDLSSVWAFAAAALLPGPVAAGVAVMLYTHIYFRVWRPTGVPLHRVVYSTATVVLAVQAASGVIRGVGSIDPFRSGAGLLAVVLALLAYAAVNMVLVVAVIVLSGPKRVPTFLQLISHVDDAALELATLSMGALVAGAMASFGPAYAVLVLPPLVVLHRSVLVRQLEEAASTDSKTGLLNASTWHLHAGRALRRAERGNGTATVLVLDIDHFKNVNDRHGHLVGDQVLAAIAATVRGEVRDDDIVGRFGGEEFVVLLRGVDGESSGAGARAVAERIRSRVAALRVEVAVGQDDVLVDGLSVSIGGAAYPSDGTELAELLEIADAAMYAAKNAGRNRVRMGTPACRPHPMTGL